MNGLGLRRTTARFTSRRKCLIRIAWNCRPVKQPGEFLSPLIHDSEEVYASYLEFASQAPLLSTADRATIALARHQLLLCASDDGLVVETCQLYGIAYTRTLRLLSEMVKRQHKTVEKVIEMAETLIEDRGKRITSQVLED